MQTDCAVLRDRIGQEVVPESADIGDKKRDGEVNQQVVHRIPAVMEEDTFQSLESLREITADPEEQDESDGEDRRQEITEGSEGPPFSDGKIIQTVIGQDKDCDNGKCQQTEGFSPRGKPVKVKERQGGKIITEHHEPCDPEDVRENEDLANRREKCFVEPL